MIFSAFQKREVVECRQEMMPAKKYIKVAIEHSLRVAAVGAGLYCVYYNWITEILLIPAMSIFIAILGLIYGYWRGVKFRKLPYLIGGILLCIIAFKVILIHF
jgi:putative Mn2+ efflux pump MntP